MRKTTPHQQTKTLLCSIVALVALLGARTAFPTTYSPKPLEELLQKTEVIAVVRVVGGHLNTIDLDGSTSECGFVYSAVVEDSLLGSGQSVEFLGKQQLRIGRRYIVFLTHGDPTSEDLMSSNSLMLPLIQEEARVDKACRADYSGYKLIEDLTRGFALARSVKSDDGWVDEEWVDASHYFIGEHGIPVYDYEVDRVTITGPRDEEVSLSRHEMFDEFTKVEGGKYPMVWLDKAVMKWDDYRAAIIEELGRLSSQINDEKSGQH